jgi:hypothetical protein
VASAPKSSVKYLINLLFTASVYLCYSIVSVSLHLIVCSEMKHNMSLNLLM